MWKRIESHRALLLLWDIFSPPKKNLNDNLGYQILWKKLEKKNRTDKGGENFKKKEKGKTSHHFYHFYHSTDNTTLDRDAMPGLEE